MSPTRALLRARWSTLRHRLVSPQARALGPGLLVALVGIAALGGLAAPALLEPAATTATPIAIGTRVGRLPGATALESAFWLTAFGASILGFRTMELLFRRHDVRAVAMLPLPLGALFLDRVLAVTLEALAAAALLMAFYVPLLWEGPWPVAAACLLLPPVGLLATAALSLGVQLFAGAQEFGHAPAARREDVGTTAGATGQIFLYAPGLALGLAVVLLLLVKLALGEVLRLERFGRATGLGLGVAGAVVAASVLVGLRDFRASFHRAVAGFREADIVGYQVLLDYQESAFGERRAGEALLAPRARPAYRVLLLEYGRRHALLRYGYPLAWLLYALALLGIEAEALPLWVAAAVPALLFGFLIDPWPRYLREAPTPARSVVLPLGADALRAARWLAATREALLVALPMGLLLAALRFGADGPWALMGAAGAALGPAGVAGAVALAGSALGVERPPAAAVFGGAVAVALAVIALIWLPALPLVALALAAMPWPIGRGRERTLRRRG